MRYFLFCVVSWVPVLWAQPLPLEIGRGEREGTVVIAVPAGGAMEGQLELVYRIIGAGGEVLDQAVETIPVDITLLFDRSGSMGDAGAFGAEVFRKGLLDEFPNVRIAIYGFSDHSGREGAEPGVRVGVVDCAPVDPAVFGVAPPIDMEPSGSVLQTAWRATVASTRKGAPTR